MDEKFSSISIEEIVGEEAGKEIQVIAFYLDRELLGIPIEKVIEISVNREITPVPKAKFYILGVMNLRGKIIPVVDLKSYMRIGKFPEDVLIKNNIVIVESLKGEVGIASDKVVGSVRFPEKEVLPEPIGSIGIDTEYISGVAQLGKDLIVLLDIDKIFQQEE